MDMKTWADKEVELALKYEKERDEDDTWYPYLVGCYKSALKAYNSLLEDNHSGMSWSVTSNILNLLMHNRPLTKLTGEDDEWFDVQSWNVHDDYTTYQNNRYSALFKDVYKDGRVVYHDNNRFSVHTKDKPYINFYSGVVNGELNKLYPIEFPYTPISYSVEIEELLSDPNNGDFDTVGIFQMKDEQGNITQINKFFHFTDDYHYEEISAGDYLTIKYNCDTREIK